MHSKSNNPGKLCCCQICHCHPKQHKCLPPEHQTEGKFYGLSTNKEHYKPLDLNAKPPMIKRKKSSGAFPNDGWYGKSTNKVKINLNYFCSNKI